MRRHQMLWSLAMIEVSLKFFKRDCRLSEKHPNEGNCKIKGKLTVLLGEN